MNTARVRSYLMLLIVAVIWGVASPVIKYTLEGFDPLIFLAYRFGISTLVAIATFSIVGWHIPKDKKIFLQVLFCGFLTSTVSLGFLFFGLENTTVLDASLITLIVPLVVSLAGVYYLHERVTRRERFGMGIAIIGTILTVIEPLLQNGHSQIRLSGNIMILGYVAATAIATVIGKRLLQKGVSPLTMTNFSFIIGFVSFLPFALNSGQSLFSVPTQYHLGVFYMALLSGSVAYYLSNRAQKSIEISEQSLFSYLYPLFSTPLAVMWLGEKITPIFILGAIIIAIGVILAETKPRASR